MTIEIVLLALASTVRPTSLAAVYALVGSEFPRRLMIVYIVAGLAFTIAFGLLVIWAFNGVDINSGSDETKGIAEIVGGIVVLTFAVLVGTGRVGGPHADDAPDAPVRWKTLLERRLSARTAALAGPATHIPGLFYLVALNVIVSHQPSVLGGLAEILVYNVVWFALPIGALAVCVIDPPAARRAVDGASDVDAQPHARAAADGVARRGRRPRDPRPREALTGYRREIWTVVGPRPDHQSPIVRGSAWSVDGETQFAHLPYRLALSFTPKCTAAAKICASNKPSMLMTSPRPRPGFPSRPRAAIASLHLQHGAVARRVEAQDQPLRPGRGPTLDRFLAERAFRPGDHQGGVGRHERRRAPSAAGRTPRAPPTGRTGRRRPGRTGPRGCR